MDVSFFKKVFFKNGIFFGFFFGKLKFFTKMGVCFLKIGVCFLKNENFFENAGLLFRKWKFFRKLEFVF